MNPYRTHYFEHDPLVTMTVGCEWCEQMRGYYDGYDDGFQGRVSNMRSDAALYVDHYQQGYLEGVEKNG